VISKELGVLELSESLFDDQVLESSKHQPVLVDFWAPWCGPCRMLGPILEKLSLDYEGRVQFVKINADHAPQLSQRYQIRSIPTVMLFRQAQAVDQFMGLKQESEIRRFIDTHLPRIEDKDLALARQLLAEGRLEEASEHYKTVLAINPSQEAARLEFVQLLLQRSMAAEAAQYFEVLRPKKLNDPRIASIALLVEAGLSLNVDPSHPTRSDQMLREAQQAMLAGQWAGAMDLFLALLTEDRRFAGDLVRQSMLAIFQLCPDAQVVGQYRRKLSALLN
jgi:putative thioredoxin